MAAYREIPMAAVTCSLLQEGSLSRILRLPRIRCRQGLTRLARARP